MAKTIADLGHDQQQPIVVGKSMLGDECRPLELRVKALEERLRAENEILELGGYDYDGNEAWAKTMENCGRR